MRMCFWLEWNCWVVGRMCSALLDIAMHLPGVLFSSTSHQQCERCGWSPACHFLGFSIVSFQLLWGARGAVPQCGWPLRVLDSQWRQASHDVFIDHFSGPWFWPMFLLRCSVFFFFLFFGYGMWKLLGQESHLEPYWRQLPNLLSHQGAPVTPPYCLIGVL